MGDSMWESNLKKAEKGAWISISAYIFLSGIKLTAGTLGHSDALQADGLNNLTDIIASIAVLIGLRISQKPPDENHRYGHSRAETIASLIAALIMFAVGFQVISQSVQSFYRSDEGSPNFLTAFVALLSAAFMFGVYIYNLKLSKKLNSKALYSAAQDNRSDALVSIGAAIGIIGTYFGLRWLDPLAAILVGLMICRTAWSIFKEASLDLTDAFEVQKLQEIEDTINQTPGVKLVKDIKARLHGNRTIVDATIFVEPTLTIVEGHQIAEDVEERLFQEHEVQDSNIHIEPQC
nr:cation diffusion facilitator family transporter [uncultured Bacillus sp.]